MKKSMITEEQIAIVLMAQTGTKVSDMPEDRSN